MAENHREGSPRDRRTAPPTERLVVTPEVIDGAASDSVAADASAIRQPASAVAPPPAQIVTRQTVTRRNAGPARDMMSIRDRLRWGPVFAGLLTAIATMLVLTVLGLAFNLSVFDPSSDGDKVKASVVAWSAGSAIIAFFLGGWVAGKTAAIYTKEQAALNGIMVGVAGLALILWLVSTGLGNLLGGIGSDLHNIAEVARANLNGNDASAAAANARQTAIDNYESARNGAWGTLGGLLLALGASSLGGLTGFKAKSYEEGDLDDRPSR